LLINLFKGYGAVSDEVFRPWLVRKQDDHEEGESITPDELMLAAKNKYDAMMEKGTWNAPTAEEKIVALEAKLRTNLKNLNKKVSFELGKKGKTSGKPKSDGKRKPKKSDDEQHPKHMSPPKTGDPKSVMYRGHKWHWCGRRRAESARSGAHTIQKSVSGSLTIPVTRRRVRTRGRGLLLLSLRNLKWPRRTLPSWNNKPARTTTQRPVNDWQGGHYARWL
jgi:hypothetical protein